MTTSLAVRTRPRPAQLAVVGTVPLVRVRPAPQLEPPYDDEVVPPVDNSAPPPEPEPHPATGGPARRGTDRGTGGTDRGTSGQSPQDAPTGQSPHDGGAGQSPQVGPAGQGPQEGGAGQSPHDGGAGQSPQEGRAGESPDDVTAGRSPRDVAARPPARAAGGAPPRIGAGGQAAYRYVGLCLEVLEGFRPVGHLRRLTVPTAFDAVAGQLGRPAARLGHRPAGETPAGRADDPTAVRRPAGAPARPTTGPVVRSAAGGTGGPVGTTGRPQAVGASRPPAGTNGRPQAGTNGRPQAGANGRLQAVGAGRPGVDRIRLRHLRVGEPRDGAVEAVAVLGRAGRSWALALRLEQREGAWLCTHVEVV